LPIAFQKIIPLRFDPGATQYREPLRPGQRHPRNPGSGNSALPPHAQSSGFAFLSLWLHFLLDFPLIWCILILVGYCVWSGGARSRFSFLGAAIQALHPKQRKTHPLESINYEMQIL
jgi:hypothetical protein